jgi:hypothetical protein
LPLRISPERPGGKETTRVLHDDREAFRLEQLHYELEAAAIHCHGERKSKSDLAKETRLSKAECRAAWKLANTRPTTVAGVIAVLRYAGEIPDDGVRWLDEDDRAYSWHWFFHRTLAAALEAMPGESDSGQRISAQVSLKTQRANNLQGDSAKV